VEAGQATLSWGPHPTRPGLDRFLSCEKGGLRGDFLSDINEYFISFEIMFNIFNTIT
jgi:hypothetical protein